MNYKITSYGEKDTIELAQNIESEKFPNMVICLMGDLGSGKTIFTKGFASALEVEEEVTSPTFNIILHISALVKTFFKILQKILNCGRSVIPEHRYLHRKEQKKHWI